MVLESALKRAGLPLPRGVSVAFIIAGLLSTSCVTTSAADDLQQISRPAVFTQMPKAAPDSNSLAAQVVRALAAPGGRAGARVATHNAAMSLPPLKLWPTSANTGGFPASLPIAGKIPAADVAQDDPETAPDPVAVSSSGEEKGSTRVNFLTGVGTASGFHYAPLTREQRWKYYVNQNFASLGAVVGPLLTSSIDQARGSPPEWGGGMEGFGKRFASRLATGIVQGTVQSAGCALLGQEPRYISSTGTTVLARIGHAFLYTFITYNNEGEKRIAVPALVSYYAAGMTTTLWLPGHHTALGDGVRDGSRKLALAALVNEWQEFWPTIRNHLHLRF